MKLNDRDDRIVVAGEYVLGTLSAAERAEVEAARVTDRELSAEIYRWQDRLLPLAPAAAWDEPDTALWNRIEASLRPGLDETVPQARVDAKLPPAAAHDTSAEPANDALWRRLRRWQIGGGLGIAASIVLAALLLLRLQTPEPAHYLTLLQSPDTQRTGWVVEATPGRQIRLVALAPGDPLPAGKTLQFWTKPQGAEGPTSLGLVQQGAPVNLPAARSPSIGEQQLFELTLEPEGGSPTGRPTGPILYVGRSVRL